MLSRPNWKKAWGRGHVYLRDFDLDKISYLSKQKVQQLLGSKIVSSSYGRASSYIDREHFSSLFQAQWNQYVTDHLIASLDDTLRDELYLKDAIDVLGEIADKRAIPSLKAHLSNTILKQEAREAIRAIESR